MQRKPQDPRRTEFLIYGLYVLITAAALVLAIEFLPIVWQLPALLVSLSVLILLARRILKIDDSFRLNSVQYNHELEKFRDENK